MKIATKFNKVHPMYRMIYFSYNKMYCNDTIKYVKDKQMVVKTHDYFHILGPK